MKISKSNVILGITPTVTTGGSSDNAVNICDADHSTNYTSSNNQYLTVDLGARAAIGYVAISGHNVTDSASNTGRISIQDGASNLFNLILERNNTAMFYFEPRNFNNLRVVFEAIGGHSNGGVTVSYIAAGAVMDVPNNGETAGYSRNHLTRGIKTRVTSNQKSQPVAIVKQAVQLSGTLNIPNATKVFSKNEWQNFLDFTTEQPFFILEDELDFSSSYTCFEPKYSAPSAHSDTRSLNNISIGFKVYNGL